MLGWLTRLIVRRLDRDDPGLRDASCKFGTKPANATTFDYAKAKAAALRAKKRSATGKVLWVPRPVAKHKRAEVWALPPRRKGTGQ